MVAVPAVLLGLGLLVGTVAALPRSLGRGAALFTDRAGYAAAAGGSAPPGAATAEAVLVEAVPTEWTAVGAGLGVFSAALACLLAAAAVWWPGAAILRRPLTAAVLPLRRLHSGLVGDYMAWLAAGMAALLVALALRMRHLGGG